MKVKKIPAREAHVGMTMVAGTKEDHTLHTITEVHVKPRKNEGWLKVKGRTAPVPFIYDQAEIRVMVEGS